MCLIEYCVMFVFDICEQSESLIRERLYKNEYVLLVVWCGYRLKVKYKLILTVKMGLRVVKEVITTTTKSQLCH